VLGPDDVFRELGIEPPAATAPAAERRSEGSGERAILRSLAREPATKDVLARRLEVSPEVLALDLIELELAGRVGLDRDGRLRVLKSS
jgi:predicted Rossmann fold nucleotide-binding protein DprA/Smf involved in DNA uptake